MEDELPFGMAYVQGYVSLMIVYRQSSFWSSLGDMRGAGVLDIGAGNANCAMLAAALMNLTVPWQDLKP